MIRMEHISLNFGNKSIFKDLNIQIKKGEKVSISGESGRGKTSLLKLILGFVLPDSGEIFVNGSVLSSKSANQLRKDIAWVPQNINLPVKTGKELMQLLNIDEKKEQIANYLDGLGLDAGIIGKDFTKISGGQKQRLVISIILGLDKSIILMDEPTASLDEKSIKLLLNVIDSMEGKTIISASHHQGWNDHSDKVIAI